MSRFHIPPWYFCAPTVAGTNKFRQPRFFHGDIPIAGKMPAGGICLCASGGPQNSGAGYESVHQGMRISRGSLMR